MLESVHCPTCSTHYGIRAARVRTGIRRARCFRCSAVFSIETAVARLTEAPVLAVPEAGGQGHEQPEPMILAAVVPALPSLGEPEPGNESVPSLTLGDLEGLEEDILAKPAEMSAPEPAAPQGEDDEGGGYRSAKDAIAKLLGGIPEPSAERRTLGRTSNQMDVEATLDALESTLGGVAAKELETRPIIPPPELTQSELEPVKPAASTLKLTHDEIMSAMKAASLPVPSPPSPPKPVQAPKPASAPQPVRETTPPETEANLLKVQVGQEIYSNVTVDQVITWIEQGRVQDFHMVARQFSENWIEAGKVPALRPVFERIRRQQSPAAQQSQAVLVAPTADTAPAKKSLFGGLFNRG